MIYYYKLQKFLYVQLKIKIKHVFLKNKSFKMHILYRGL